MKKNKRLFKSFFLLLALSTQAFGAVSDVDKAIVGAKNNLKNPGFENGIQSWSASGGTLSKTTSAANVDQGRTSGSWDSSAASQTLTSNAVSITSGGGLSGQSIAGSCRIKCSTGTCTHKIQIYDGSTVLTEQQITSSTDKFSRSTVTVTAPTSGSIYLRLASVASNEPTIYIDDCYLGLAEVFNTAAASAGINYLSANPDAEANTNGWSTYADGSATPSTGTGGSPTATFTRSTNSPLRGSASFLYTPGNLGNGFSYDFTIDSADKAQVLKVSFNYELSGTITEGDYQVWVKPLNGTDTTIKQLAPYRLSGTSGTQYPFAGTFQTTSDATQYRLIIHQAATTSVTLKTDNYSVGPQSITYSAPVIDWKSATFTLRGQTNGVTFTNQTTTGYIARVGDQMLGRVYVNFTGTPGGGTGNYELVLPNGHSIDTTKMPSAVAFKTIVGSAESTQGSSANQRLGAGVFYYTSNSLGISQQNGSANAWSTTAPFTWGNLDQFTLQFTVPIAGWSSSVVMSDSADTRTTSFRIHWSGGTVSVPQNVETKLANLSLVSKDTHGAWNSTTKRYVIPTPGDYVVFNEFIDYANSGGTTAGTFRGVVYVNGAAREIVGINDLTPAVYTGAFPKVSGMAVLTGMKAGDYVEFYAYTSANGTTSAVNGIWSLFKLSGPSAIAASESVNAKYVINSTIALAGATATTIAYPVRKWNTHEGTYNTSTGIYTVNTPGKFRIKATLTVASATLSTSQAFTMSARNITRGENAEGSRIFGNGTAQSWMSSVDAEFDCLAGDQLDVRYYIAVASNTLNVGDFNQLTIERVGN